MERHLAAILSADVVGYSQLMRRDEVGTLAALKKIRAELVVPKTSQYRGRSIKLMGDGELMEFPSIVDAVTCSVEIQLAMMKRNRDVPENEQIWFRIGINVGDIIVDEEDIYGDGVNLASRVENIAEPGGICLTNTARSQIINQLGLDFRDLGQSEIKGFEKPIRVYSVVLDDKAEAMVTPVNSMGQTAYAGFGGYGQGKNQGLMGTKTKLGLATASIIAGVYGLVGGVQYLSDDSKITTRNVFCPILEITTDQNPVVRIGTVLPTQETHGLRMQWGVNHSIRDNRSKYPFTISLNLQDTSDGLEAMLTGLDNFDKSDVLGVIGPMQSSYAFYAKKWANQTNTPVISPLASASYLTSPGEKDFFFRATMSDGARARNLVEWVTAKGLQNNPYLIHEWSPPIVGEDAPEIYGASQATAAKRYLKSAETIRFTRGNEETMLEAVEKVENDGRAILIFGYTSNIKIIIKALQDKGVENDIFLMGVVTKSLEEGDFAFPQKLHVVTPDVSEARSLTDSAALRRDFEDDNPTLEYDISTYYAYDSVTILLDAITAARQNSCANRVDGEMVAEALRKTPNKRRKMLNSGFMTDTQEVFFRYDGLKMFNGKFRHVGIGE